MAADSQDRRPSPFPGNSRGGSDVSPKFPLFPIKSGEATRTLWNLFYPKFFPLFPFPSPPTPPFPKGFQHWNRSRDSPIMFHKILMIPQILGNFWECSQGETRNSSGNLEGENPRAFREFLCFPNFSKPREIWEVWGFGNYGGWKWG